MEDKCKNCEDYISWCKCNNECRKGKHFFGKSEKCSNCGITKEIIVNNKRNMKKNEEEIKKEYKILSNIFIFDLQDKVQEYIDNGWELLGGVCVDSTTGAYGRTTYYQTILKINKNI